MILDPSHNSFQNDSLHHDCHNPPPFLDHLHRPLVADPPERQATNSRGRVYFPFFGHGFKTFVHTVKNTVMRTLIGSDGVRRVRVGHMSLPRSFFSAISCHSSRVSGFLQTSRYMLVCWYGVPNWEKIGLFLGVLATTVGGLFSFRTRLPILIHTSRICHLCDFHCVCMVVLDNVVWYHGIRVIIGIIKTFSDRSYR